MKQRILTGWSFIRVLYLAMGIFIIIQSVMQKQWFGLVFGGYFAAMGLFRFGCAAGNCFSGNCSTKTESKIAANITDTAFEEVKTK